MRNILIDFLKLIFPGKDDWTNWHIGLIIGMIFTAIVVAGISKI